MSDVPDSRHTPTPAEVAELCRAVGALVIRAGHVEWGMVRTLAWVRDEHPGGGDFARLGWSALVSSLRADAATSSDAQTVEQILDEHQIDRLTTIRNNVIHGRVLTQSAPNFTAVRQPSRGAPATVAAPLTDLLAAEQDMAALSRSLELALPEPQRRVNWPAEDGA